MDTVFIRNNIRSTQLYLIPIEKMGMRLCVAYYVMEAGLLIMWLCIQVTYHNNMDWDWDFVCHNIN